MKYLFNLLNNGWQCEPVRQLLLGIPRINLHKTHVIMFKSHLHIVQYSTSNACNRNYLSYTVTTITSSLPIAREFVLEINIKLPEIKIQYGGDV